MFSCFDPGRGGADADPVQGCGTRRRTRWAVRGRALGGVRGASDGKLRAGRHGSRRRPLESIIDIALRGSSVFQTLKACYTMKYAKTPIKGCGNRNRDRRNYCCVFVKKHYNFTDPIAGSLAGKPSRTARRPSDPSQPNPRCQPLPRLSLSIRFVGKIPTRFTDKSCAAYATSLIPAHMPFGQNSPCKTINEPTERQERPDRANVFITRMAKAKLFNGES